MGWLRRQRVRQLLPLILPIAILLVCSLLTPAKLSGETIHLKNGRKIVADILREDERQIYVSHGGGEYSIPRLMVDRIEKGEAPDASSGFEGAGQSDRTSDLPLPPPPAEDPGPDSEAVKNDTIDRVYLAQLDEEASRKPTPRTCIAWDKATSRPRSS